MGWGHEGPLGQQGRGFECGDQPRTFDIPVLTLSWYSWRPFPVVLPHLWCHPHQRLSIRSSKLFRERFLPAYRVGREEDLGFPFRAVACSQTPPGSVVSGLAGCASAWGGSFVPAPLQAGADALTFYLFMYFRCCTDSECDSGLHTEC